MLMLDGPFWAPQKKKLRVVEVGVSLGQAALRGATKGAEGASKARSKHPTHSKVGGSSVVSAPVFCSWFFWVLIFSLCRAFFLRLNPLSLSTPLPHSLIIQEPRRLSNQCRPDLAHFGPHKKKMFPPVYHPTGCCKNFTPPQHGNIRSLFAPPHFLFPIVLVSLWCVWLRPGQPSPITPTWVA